MSYNPSIFASYNHEIELCVVEVFRDKYLFKLFLAFNPAYRELTVSCWDDMNNGYIRFRFASLTYKRLLDCVNKSLRGNDVWGSVLNPEQVKARLQALKCVDNWDIYNYSNPFSFDDE